MADNEYEDEEQDEGETEEEEVAPLEPVRKKMKK